jgi:hypothetical protein
VSTTGNLLFPDDEDDGWIASIQKALPKKKKLDFLEIEDPVADAAQASFAETAAETATQDTISTARLAVSLPLMSAMLGYRGASSESLASGGVRTCVPLKWLTRASKFGGASTSTSLAQAASGPWMPGQIRPRPEALA